MKHNLNEIDKKMSNFRYIEGKHQWYNPLDSEDFVLHGLPFYDINKNYHRLKDESINKSLDTLSMHPSGGYFSFVTDSTSINVQVETSSNAYMAHMSACGQCGLDLYYFEDSLKKFVFIGTTKINEVKYILTFVKGMEKKKRLFRLYLPIYIPLISLFIGLDSDSTIEKGECINETKIVFYGTSITQGGCATRPSMSTSSIVGRNVKCEVYNLGFSGSAQLEKEVALQIADIQNTEILFIEAEANAGETGNLFANLETFLDITTPSAKQVFLFSRYPTPVVLIDNNAKEKALRNYKFQKNISKKYKNVKFIDGFKLLKHLNFEETVDTVHLTDLGFYELALKLLKLIEKTAPHLLYK